MQLAAERLELAQVRQPRAGLVVEPHVGVDELADGGEGGGEELVGELDSGVGLVLLAGDVDLLEDLLPQEVLEPQLAVALAHELGVLLGEFWAIGSVGDPDNDDGLQD